MTHVVVFRSHLRPEAAEAYSPTAEAMERLARAQPGFLEVKTFTAPDGERVTLASFESDRAVRAWGAHPEHRAAQARGRAEFYASYRLEVCELVRRSDFTREG